MTLENWPESSPLDKNLFIKTSWRLLFPPTQQPQGMLEYGGIKMEIPAKMQPAQDHRILIQLLAGDRTKTNNVLKINGQNTLWLQTKSIDFINPFL